jgi:hypothetical protein
VASSTTDYLQILLLRGDVAATDVAQFVPAPATTGTDPDIEVHIHSSVVFSALGSDDQGSSMAAVLDSPWYGELLKLSKTALSAAGNEAPPSYKVAWSDGGQWLRLEWSAHRGPKTTTVSSTMPKNAP